jgi:hypothetical protein
MNCPPLYHIEQPSKNLAQKSDDRSIFFIWCKKRCPLSFNDRLVWSYLLKCEQARGEGASQSGISQYVGLDRQTVGRSLHDRLREHGLVEKVHSRAWRAIEPTEDSHDGWFAPRRQDSEEAHWGNKMAYWPVFLTDGHRPFDVVLLALLRTLKGGEAAVTWESYEWLSIPMGCNWRTVKSALKKRLPVEIFAGTKNRFGKVDRFDILLTDGPIKRQEKRGTIPPRRPKKAEEHPAKEEAPQETPPQSGDAGIREATETLPPSLWDLLKSPKVARLRAVDAEVSEVLQKAGYEEYQIGNVLWSLEKATTDGDIERGRRLFYAVFKRFKTPDQVVAALQKDAAIRRRAQREEAEQLRHLEDMSRYVSV